MRCKFMAGLFSRRPVLIFCAVLATGCLATPAENIPLALAASTHSSSEGVQKSMAGWPKSRFYGAIKLKFKGDDVYIHIYDTKRADSSPNRSRYGAHDYAPNERSFESIGLTTVVDSGTQTFLGVQRCALVLLVRHKNGRFRRINSIQFDYVRGEGVDFSSTETVDADTRWLDPEWKRIPIIIINLRDMGVEGPVGTNMVVVFPHDLSGKPVAEGFGYGADNSSDHNSWGWSFKKPDARGYLTVQAELDTKSSVTRTLLQWDGRYFVLRKTTFKSWMI